MNRKRFFFLVFSFFTLLLLLNPQGLISQNILGLQDKIEEYTQKIIQLGKAQKTLKNEIIYIDTQNELTLLQIAQTENSIKTLKQEISTLSVKINHLDIDLNLLSQAFIQQITQSYKLQKRISPVFSLISGGFNDFLQQQKYLITVQKHSRDTLLSMETIRTNFDRQKTQKAQKQKELEQLQTQLDHYKNNLAQQKLDKSNLLTVTKNDEVRYQQLKQAAESELQALLSAKLVGSRKVAKGEAIGLMGNTGYSFGDHLHFGLYQLSASQLTSWSYTNDLDPRPYISQHRWPMNDPISITQNRGHTQYSYLYSDRFHHGIDLISPNKTITAINEGVAYFFRNTKSSLGNHVKLFHPDGKMTLYLHMQ